MPVIYPPKLTELVGNNLYIPSSITTTTPVVNLVLSSDGNGGTRWIDAQSTISTALISTVVGLGSAGYISSTQLFSTVNGLGSAGYISSTQLFSTVNGLGSAGYISSLTLKSTLTDFVSTSQLFSTTSSILNLIPILNFGWGETDITGVQQIVFFPNYTSVPSVSVTGRNVNPLQNISSIFFTSNITTTTADVLSLDPTTGVLSTQQPFSWISMGV